MEGILVEGCGFTGVHDREVENCTTNQRGYGHVQRVRLLYKTILKLHRGMPPELQAIGNSYTKDEFKRHKKCNTAEAAVFMNEWTKYALDLSEQLGLRGPKTAREIGDNLDEEALYLLRDEQIAQLYELHLAATAPRKKET